MSDTERKLLISILHNIITALYPTMGREWCEEMGEMVSKIMMAGKA